LPLESLTDRKGAFLFVSACKDNKYCHTVQATISDL